MPRLSAADLARARDVEHSLALIDEQSPPLHEWFARVLRDYLGAGKGCTYAAAIADEGFELDFVHIAGTGGPRVGFTQAIDCWIRSASGQFGLYHPVRPETFQRNVVLPVGSFVEMARGRSGRLDANRLWRRSPHLQERVLESLGLAARVFRAWNISHDQQLRMLVCDGPVLLSWVGVFQPEPYSARQIRLFRRIARALQFRARLEARMRAAPLHLAGLEAALEAIAGEAFIVSRCGRVIHANSAGRAAWDRSPRSLVARLAAATRGAPGYEITPLARRGGGAAMLVVASASPSLEERVRRIAARFELPTRQRQVLAALAAGMGTRRIADALGCSERTVEVHISKLLERLDVTNRAQLIAKVLA